MGDGRRRRIPAGSALAELGVDRRRPPGDGVPVPDVTDSGAQRPHDDALTELQAVGVDPAGEDGVLPGAGDGERAGLR